jgi:hypothetical protein
MEKQQKKYIPVQNLIIIFFLVFLLEPQADFNVLKTKGKRKFNYISKCCASAEAKLSLFDSSR